MPRILKIIVLLMFLTGVALFVYSFMSHISSIFEVTVFKGPVSGAIINIYELDVNGGRGDLIMGPLTSDASGNVNFNLPPNLPKRLFIESKGGLYKSESTGQQVQMRDADVLTAVLPAGTETAAVTPFTHMAAALAQAEIQSGISADEAVISANEAVAKQYGLKSIFDTVPVDVTNSNADQATLEEKQYGLLLGGFAQLAKNLNVRSIELANALAKDWSDGTVDGKEGGNPITISNGPKLGSAGINGLNDAVNQFAKSEKNYTSLRESSISLNPVLEKIGLRITTVSLPSWISGVQGSYAITAKGGFLPLAWSVKAGSIPEGFTLSKDGIISGIYTLSGGVTKKIFPQFTLEVKDQQGQTQSVTLSITVTPEAPQITTYNPSTLTVDESYDEVIARATGGMPPYIFSREPSSGPMPFGMQITSSGSNAVLTGSPQAKGNFSFRVCVVDSASTEKCGNVAFKVEEAEEEETLTWDGYYYPGTYDCNCVSAISQGACPINYVKRVSSVVVHNNQIEAADNMPFQPDNITIDSNGYTEVSWQRPNLDRELWHAKYQFTKTGNTVSVEAIWTERHESNGSSSNYTCTHTFTSTK